MTIINHSCPKQGNIQGVDVANNYKYISLRRRLTYVRREKYEAKEREQALRAELAVKCQALAALRTVPASELFTEVCERLTGAEDQLDLPKVHKCNVCWDSWKAVITVIERGYCEDCSYHCQWS